MSMKYVITTSGTSTPNDEITININGYSYPTIDFEHLQHTNPCEHCMNNPKNNRFASGICNCVLPYINNIIY